MEQSGNYFTVYYRKKEMKGTVNLSVAITWDLISTVKESTRTKHNSQDKRIEDSTKLLTPCKKSRCSYTVDIQYLIENISSLVWLTTVSKNENALYGFGSRRWLDRKAITAGYGFQQNIIQLSS